VGFRELRMFDNIPQVVRAAIQHVLGRVDIRCVTLAVPDEAMHQANGGMDLDRGVYLLIRFEGLGGSLEITDFGRATHQNIFFGPEGVLFSYSPPVKDVKELHIIGCSFDHEHIYTAMPNLVSISIFRCTACSLSELLIPAHLPSPPFPHLERITVLGQGSGLGEVAKRRKDCGIPLKTVIVGRGLVEYDHPDYSELGEFLDELHIGYPTKTLQWETKNEVLHIWATDEWNRGSSILDENNYAFKFYQVAISG